MFLDQLLALGPVGGIDPSVGAYYAIFWTIILGGILYGSVVFFPAWVDMGEKSEKH